MDEENSDIPNPVIPQQEDKEQLEDTIVALRQEKARTKTLFTKARRRLLVLIQEKMYLLKQFKMPVRHWMGH